MGSFHEFLFSYANSHENINVDDVDEDTVEYLEGILGDGSIGTPLSLFLSLSLSSPTSLTHPLYSLSLSLSLCSFE
jgi:hypothetical protein